MSPERLAPYIATTGGNKKLALRLYQWNIGLSGATYEALHIFEVVLRNAIDRRLRSWNLTQTQRSSGRSFPAEWTLNPAPVLARLLRPALPEATGRAALATATHHRQPGHDDVVAQLTMGAWRYLLPDRDPGRRYLWRAALSQAFPRLQRPVEALVSDVDGLYRLRNRIAHLESILVLGRVNHYVAAMRRVLNEIDPVVESWFTSQQRISAVIKSRPR